MKHRIIKISLFLLLVNPIGFGCFSFAQDDGATLFDDLCADCHSVGDGDMRGPDLLGVEQNHKQEWLIAFIRSSQTMINAGDADAVKIWEQFGKKKMPNQDITDADIKLILGYIKSFNKSAPAPEAKAVVESDGSEVTTTVDVATTSEGYSSTNGDVDQRLDEIEKKLETVLDFNKKMLSARVTDEEIEKGKNLFEGNKQFMNGAPACVSCHNVYKIDTLNWNPSAYDIASIFSRKINGDISNIIINPSSDKMKGVLKDHDLTDDEAFYITAFLQNLKQTGLLVHRKIPVKLIVFVLVCLFFLIIVIDLIFTKYIMNYRIHLLLILISGGYIAWVIYLSASQVGISQGYAPIQPIKFSHRIHVSENKIQCIFCHNSPEYSRESGIPTTNVCMNCHNKIKSGTMTGKFEINKIKKSYKDKKPIEWIKIHNLPDFVFFSHAQHINVGKIKCQTCHGDIENMDVTRQYSSLSMGWCINCHRKAEVNFIGNKYYSGYHEIKDKLKNGIISKVTPDMLGANDCQKCHY